MQGKNSRPINDARHERHKHHQYSPLCRLFDLLSRVLPSRPSNEVVVMIDTPTSDVVIAPLISPLAPSSSVDGSSSLGKRRHKEAFEHSSQQTAGSSSPGLNSIDPTSTDIPALSSCPPAPPPSPAPTEIALDLPLTHEEHMEILHAEGIKVRDFARTDVKLP
jgi:hypothetical protein